MNMQCRSEADNRKLYERRSKQFAVLQKKQSRAADRISTFRLIVFIAGAAAAVFLYFMQYYILLAAVICAAAVLFIYLGLEHDKLMKQSSYTGLLSDMNRRGVQRLDGGWKDFEDTGGEFSDDSHSYSQDLDVFGKGSLFQWISSAHTFTGRQKLRDALAEGCRNPSEISDHQEAIDEIAALRSWRQRFETEALLISKDSSDPSQLLEWAESNDTMFNKAWLSTLVIVLPVISGLAAAAAFFTDWIPLYVPVTGWAIQLGLLKLKARETDRIFGSTAAFGEDLKVYKRMIGHFEGKRFKAQYINKLRMNMLTDGGNPASKQLKTLTRIVESMSNRHNAYYILFNILTLWDFQSIRALENWKQVTGRKLRSWLDSIGEMEALSSLAQIRYEHPRWAFPALSEGAPFIKAKGLGHPLLPESRVGNDLAVGKPSPVLLITGSNMSGKSTLLRTAGISLVLAYAGAPVCAGEFSCSRVELHTCMRTGDDLERGISSFYAELLRIKSIVKAAEESRNVFFLLDEIFKGTNSRDRHTGARVLVMKLAELGCAGLVSTHDLELAELEQESRGSVKNCHFSEHYTDEGISFDYKLKPGVSQTRNAVYLMKLAGIDINE